MGDPVRPAPPGALGRLGGRGRRPAGVRGPARPDDRTGRTADRGDGVADGVRQCRRRGQPRPGRRRARRGDRPGRLRRRAGAVAVPRGSAEPRGLARLHREAPGHRPGPAPQHVCAQARRGRPDGHRRPARRSVEEVGDVDDALDDHIGDDLLRLVFTTCHPVAHHRVAGRADPPAARRPHDDRGRARAADPGSHCRTTHLTGQADAGDPGRLVRAAAPPRRCRSGSARCSRSST